MRDFEFRAWDGDLKAIVSGDDIETFRMPPPPDSESADEGPSRYITGLSYGKLFVAYYRNGDWQECKIMQFTGLHDKNGKEIYEGDIVIHPDFIIKEGAVIQWSENDCSWSVGVGWPFSEFYDGTEGVKNCEVIGNIYENPDLVTP